MPSPILCAHLLRRVDTLLVELLNSLAPEEWVRPTIVPHWTVRDIAAHLLDTVLRKLSMVRDGCFVERPAIRSPQDVVDLVNRLNREGVTVYRRMSPSVLISMMTWACRESANFHESLDPFAPAVFPVSWAGDEVSPNWFDTARELTERWHHQQQIRDAVNRPGLMTPELYRPVLDCFARGLPYAYRGVPASLGTAVRLVITGPCGGSWQIRRGPSAWQWDDASDTPVDCLVTLPQEIAWRVFTKGISREEVLSRAIVQGSQELCLAALSLTAIVA